MVLKRALATGDFGIKNTNSSSKVGVAQVLNSLNICFQSCPMLDALILQ